MARDVGTLGSVTQLNPGTVVVGDREGDVVRGVLDVVRDDVVELRRGTQAGCQDVADREHTAPATGSTRVELDVGLQRVVAEGLTGLVEAKHLTHSR